MTYLNPYLIFAGNCEEAFKFYQDAFGGEFASVSRYKDAPSQNALSPGDAERLLHISLPIGGNSVLMGSDQPESYGATVIGSNFNISIHPDSKEKADALFNALSESGKVTMKMHQAFWGSYFGMFIDKYGVRWLINCETEPAK